MSTKSTTTQLTDTELKLQRKIKSVELAIKSQGKSGCQVTTLMKVAKEIYDYISS